MSSTAPSSSHRWSLGWSDLLRGLAAVVAAAFGFQLCSWLLPGFRLTGVGQGLLAAIGLGLLGLLLRPVLVWLATKLGWLGAILLALFGQGVVIWLLFRLFGGVDSVTFWAALVTGWVVAGFMTLGLWIASAGTDDAVTSQLLRQARRRPPAPVPDPEVPGVVFVQLDGLPYPVLHQSIKGGTLPTLGRWVRSGSHHMAEWRPKLPATTPASQMGILHGTIEGIPAFRWVDRPTQRVFVANHPPDAADIEAMHSDGRGLLADDGVSVSNLFTGDAALAYATMSAIRRTQETVEARQSVAKFLASPLGLGRSVARTVSEVFRERFQAHKEVARDLQPRVERDWHFAGERAALNGVMRDLNTSLVAQAMLAGHRAIYVDYVDYDAVAHHAGILRPESLDALAGVDVVLRQLEDVAAVAPRRYHFVVLSDHGQSQGTVFADRYGEDLAALTSRLADTPVVRESSDDPEGAGRLSALGAWAASSSSTLTRVFGSASGRLGKDAYGTETIAAPSVPAQPAAPAGPVPVEPSAGAGHSKDGPTDDRFIVFGSGNLGLIFAAGEDHRLTREELEARWPALLPGLAAHPGVGFVVVSTADLGPVAIGRSGEHRLSSGEIVGDDPLAPFGPDAPAFVLRAASMPESPDVLVNSLVDDMGEVAAFEGLVGCHGGLGGWQDRAMVVWPADWSAPDDMIVGADAMHRQLVEWLEALGHRRDLPPARPRPYDLALQAQAQSNVRQ